jgi:predicted nucleic acid-binding Zn ribbon protein
MSGRRAPRPAAAALRRVIDRRAPATLLAAVQAEWPRACGAAIGSETQPVAERDGVITVACRSATWAAELDMMQDQLRSRLNQALGGERVEGLRFTADGARHGLT